MPHNPVGVPSLILASAVLGAFACSPTESPARWSDPVSHRLPVDAPLALPTEPAIVVSPDGTHVRIVLQMERGYNRGGLRFFTWWSSDGGASWSRGELAPSPLAAEPTMAADATLAATVDGQHLFVGIYGDGMRGRVPEAALAVARSADAGSPLEPAEVVGRTIEHDPDHFVVSDKPWLIHDDHPTSSFAGTSYLAWTRVEVRFREGTPSLARRVVLTALRPGAPGFGHEVAVAPEGIGVQMDTDPDGRLHLVWAQANAVGDAPAEAAIMHTTSEDGGRTFGPARLVATAQPGSTVSSPTFANGGNGSSLVCWGEGPREVPERTAVRCSRRSGGRWAPAFASDATATFPALAGIRDGWALLTYETGQGGPFVVLRKLGVDGVEVAASDTLATFMEGSPELCLRAGAPCRADADSFLPGDYVGLAASDDRIFAAYVLPAAAGEPDGEAWVSVVSRIEPR